MKPEGIEDRWAKMDAEYQRQYRRIMRASLSVAAIVFLTIVGLTIWIVLRVT